MGYPPQPPYGYGPAAPPPRQSNTGLILLLAIGLPLLLLGGCGAVVLVVANAGQEAVRERVAVLEAEPPTVVLPSHPPASPPPTAGQQPTTAAVGGSLTLAGNDPGLKVTVTVARVVDRATPDRLSQPDTGKRLVAVEVTLQNSGQAVYDDSPSNGAILIDGEGQQYRTTLRTVQEGQGLGGGVTINTGDIRKGVIVFELPESASPAKFQFTLNSGFADQTGEWTLA
ncbi:DUF4352 domain-containing protein [Nonomuraea maritima]|uniref:DUF4352 domain-containing protein n=1 Tax=Nonomuraea maritima TaxID=683260 RepID=UPI003716DB4F